MQTHSTRKGWQAFRTTSTQPSRVISGSKVGFNFARNLLPANEREKFGGTFLRRNLMTRIHRWAKYSKNLYHHRPFRSFLSHESFDERLLDYLFTRCLEKSLFFFLSFFLSCIVRELDQLKVEEFKYPGIPRITKHLNCTVLWITRWKNATTLEYNHSRVGKFLFIVSMFRGRKTKLIRKSTTRVSREEYIKPEYSIWEKLSISSVANRLHETSSCRISGKKGKNRGNFNEEYLGKIENSSSKKRSIDRTDKRIQKMM